MFGKSSTIIKASVTEFISKRISCFQHNINSIYFTSTRTNSIAKKKRKFDEKDTWCNSSFLFHSWIILASMNFSSQESRFLIVDLLCKRRNFLGTSVEKTWKFRRLYVLWRKFFWTPLVRCVWRIHVLDIQLAAWNNTSLKKEA